MVTDGDVKFFKEKGYLIIRDFLSDSEVQNLKQWTREVHGWIPTESSDFMPYEVRFTRQIRVFGSRIREDLMLK